MEELSFGGVVRKKWRDITHSHAHYPTNFQTPQLKKNFSPKWRKRKEGVPQSFFWGHDIYLLAPERGLDVKRQGK